MLALQAIAFLLRPNKGKPVGPFDNPNGTIANAFTTLGAAIRVNFKI
jgi:hypothetical protein